MTDPVLCVLQFVMNTKRNYNDANFKLFQSCMESLSLDMNFEKNTTTKLTVCQTDFWLFVYNIVTSFTPKLGKIYLQFLFLVPSISKWCCLPPQIGRRFEKALLQIVQRPDSLQSSTRLCQSKKIAESETLGDVIDNYIQTLRKSLLISNAVLFSGIYNGFLKHHKLSLPSKKNVQSSDELKQLIGEILHGQPEQTFQKVFDYFKCKKTCSKLQVNVHHKGKAVTKEILVGADVPRKSNDIEIIMMNAKCKNKHKHKHHLSMSKITTSKKIYLATVFACHRFVETLDLIPIEKIKSSREFLSILGKHLTNR